MFLLAVRSTSPILRLCVVERNGMEASWPFVVLKFGVRSATPIFGAKCVQTLEKKRVGQKAVAQVCVNILKQAT
jgi:hypothetical protein